jgi:hypothetical protein
MPRNDDVPLTLRAAIYLCARQTSARTNISNEWRVRCTCWLGAAARLRHPNLSSGLSRVAPREQL